MVCLRLPQVQLSTYGDSLGKNLTELREFIDNNLQGVIGGVHLLPIYPSSGDGGFAPLCYDDVDPHFGKWEDVEAIAKEYDLMLELMINHISPKSAQFQDFLEKGDASEHASMFIDWQKFWGSPDRPNEEDLKQIRTRKADMPMLPVTLKDGSKRELWCTFGPEQIDIDIDSPSGRKFVEDSLRSLCSRGARMVRLDAYGYATKKPGTRCFFEEPEAWQILKDLEKISDEYDSRLLCEVHEEYSTNIALALHGYWVYDFSLPLLILHAFTFKTMDNLRHWLGICPRRQITVLDTHDGMGIDDIAGLAEVCDVEQLQEVVEHRLGCNPNMKYLYSGRQRGYVGNPHQYNCTYFSALHGNARHYLMARAIQFFTPGLPMVYYVGLLAGRNDHESADRDNNPRGINRHKFSLEEADEAAQQPVVQALFDLCRFRNQHPAFNGKARPLHCYVTISQDTDSHCLEVTWKNGKHSATLHADVVDMSFEIIATLEGEKTGELHTFKYTLDDTDTYEPTMDECVAPAVF
ncbi:sucrose phosphorylase [Coccomyxa subellipsoidea C-169]|uniref:Sucrose phosphorylase n=1 Tax=Coccomyxa subellipsoidea (strain C-169) TaxID=574566 RepID=I0YRS8_COCSC|nr:sucrose phosphorylase [Coccomyxa subellipsoidea C-169]EIE21097.1 sucrose phosphorylase [Coccomyxa subellipsoidea C-169]|eukprot:XP_005645641.1 sucrose phosphorylase [Coccomyxa subellipsoidea C-169]